jgi:hypothetical protein
MERTMRRVRGRRFANPLPSDNFLKKGWLKRLGGTVAKVAGTVSGRESLAQTGDKWLQKGRAEKAAVLAKEKAKKEKSIGGNVGNMDLSIDMPMRVSSTGAPVEIKKIADSMPSDRVKKGQKILETGLGILSDGQKKFAQGQTDPSRLPKTRSLKEAEQKLLLPQKLSGAASVADTIKTIDKKWLIIGGIVLAIGLVTFFMLRK